MSLDLRALALAITIELALLGLAAFGGPHGALGGWPWLLQLPSILLVFAIPDESWFLVRVAVGATLQVALWYAIIAAIRRRLRPRVAAPPQTP